MADFLTHLQRTVGNAAVQRLVQTYRSQDTDPQVQRYNVPFQPTADCRKVVNWINTSGPYSATSGAARTNTRLVASWGQPKAEGKAPDFIVSVPNLKVTVNKTAPDMPQWSPKDPAVAQAWGSSMADLRAHEALHEEKGLLYERVVQNQLQMMKVPVSATTPTDATNKARQEFSDAFTAWKDNLQASHDSIDPYTAKIACPSP